MSQQEIENFAQFARQRLDQSSVLSLEECLRQWREEFEESEVIDDIRQGLADHAAGLATPLQQTFESLRRDLELRQ
jgi:predicted transcriptional regulator